MIFSRGGFGWPGLAWIGWGVGFGSSGGSEGVLKV
jgi:hypothetical protein